MTLDFRIPQHEVWSKMNAHQYLERIAREGLERRMEGAIPGQYRERLDYELDVIEKCGFSQYFLVVADYVNYAKRMNILVAPGQGSESGSLLVYCLGITVIDPILHNLSFEMFIDPQRISFPDIDVSLSARGRREVIGYLSDKYGKESVARMDLLNVGFISHDPYSLRQLNLMQKILDLLRTDGVFIDVSTFPLDDQRIYAFLRHGDISGVFSYKEHRMKGLLDKIRPQRFHDLVSLVAINSSPSMNKNIVDEYVKNRNAPSLAHYETPLLEEILSDAYGIIIYVEQVKKIATAIARFSADEFSTLKRVIMLQESIQQIKDFEDLFIAKSVHKGVSEDGARRIYRNMLDNGKNICSKARATASALLAYRMAYLKANYYEHFMSAVRSKQ